MINKYLKFKNCKHTIVITLESNLKSVLYWSTNNRLTVKILTIEEKRFQPHITYHAVQTV